MKTLKQLISYILIFQFCFACTGGGGSSSLNSSTSIDDGTTINLQGTLARAINNFGEIFISSAAAQDGTIEVMDLSNPSKPISMGTFDIEDESQGFSIDIPSYKIKGKVISLEYEGGEKTAIGSRSVVIQVEEDKTSFSVEEMNEDSTLQSNIIKAKLQDESPESIDELKKRFTELNEQKSEILNQINKLGINIKELNKYIKNGAKDQNIASEIARALTLSVEGSEDERQNGLKKFSELAGDLISSTNLNCEDNSAKFASAKMSSYKVTVLALTSLLQEMYGEKEIEVGLANSQDDVNDVISKTLTQFRDTSLSLKEEQTISIIVRDEKGDFKGACQISSLLDDNNEDSSIKPSYFDLSPLENHTFQDEVSLRDRIQIIFKIHNEIFEAGRAKIIQEVDNSNLNKNSGSLILFEEYNNEIELYHLKINSINEENNNSDYKIDLNQMISLSCSSYPSLEEFTNSLQQVHDKTLETYQNKFPDNDGGDDFKSQIDSLSFTAEIKRRSCDIYFSIDQISLKEAAKSAE